MGDLSVQRASACLPVDAVEVTAPLPYPSFPSLHLL